MNAFSMPKPAAPAPVAAPPPPEPVRIPSMNDPDIRAGAKQATQDEFAKRKGRDSTKLTPVGSDPAYTRTTLG